MHLDISKLDFAKQNDRQNQRITFVAAFFDPQGKMVTAKEGRMDLALKPETYDASGGRPASMRNLLFRCLRESTSCAPWSRKRSKEAWPPRHIRSMCGSFNRFRAAAGWPSGLRDRFR